MKHIILLAIMAALVCTRSTSGQEPEEPSDTPREVLQFLEHSVGSWYATLGTTRCACTVNSRANGRCVLLEGRRFSDAISFTCLFGWYAPSEQIIGLIIFENGESLLVRAKVRSESEHLEVKGSVVGILRSKPVTATYTSVRGGNTWSIVVTTTDGEVIKGRVQDTASR